MTRQVDIIGAGPAGLTAAYWLLKQRPNEFDVTVYEKRDRVGGICRTVDDEYGNFWDIGGHRFHTHIPRVQALWDEVFPNMPLRKRKSLILFRGKYFPYPPKPSLALVKNLGLKEMATFYRSYRYCRRHPRKGDDLATYFINTFGRRAYETFFQTYTEKLWGRPAESLPASVGAQRVKGWSIWDAFVRREGTAYTSFRYPFYGVGEFWDQMAQCVQKMGGKIVLNHKYVGMPSEHVCFTSAPLTHPELKYRALVTVGLIVKGKVDCDAQWIYVQEPGLSVGRVQICNNWSPYLAHDPEHETLVSMEYFCNPEAQAIHIPDAVLTLQATAEFVDLQIGSGAILGAKVSREPYAYPVPPEDPALPGRIIVNSPHNVYRIGRSGRHEYLNMDSVCLNAMETVNRFLREC